MERKIGEVFTCNGELYQIVKSSLCNDYAFMKNGSCYTVNELLGPCDYTKRTDKINVIFKKINNMEIKNNQLTINIPKGYIIDVEHSDLSKGIIKFKKDNITLEDIYEYQGKDTFITNVIIKNTHTYSKIYAIATLMDIANYYNGGWEYDFTKGDIGYMIVYDTTMTEPRYVVHKFDSITKAYYGNPIFKNEADAQYVIDNPNFRDILDTIYKN